MMKVPWSSVNPYSLSFSREHGWTNVKIPFVF
jgi:hypothetical protein